MKKIFTLTILLLMAILTIVNSCSKKSDSTATPNNGTTALAVGVDSVVVDGGIPIALNSVSCITGSANIFTMTFASNDNYTYLMATFSAQPTANATYNIKYSPPSATTDVQLQISQAGLTGTYFVAQNGGTATLTFVNNKIQLSFANIHFVKTGSPDKVVSSTILCN